MDADEPSGDVSPQLQYQLQQQKALTKVITRIRSSLDFDTIFETSAVEVRALLQADRVAIFQFDPDQDWAGKFVAENQADGLDSALEQQVYDHCFSKRFLPLYQSGRASAIDNIYENGLQECHVKILARFQVKANLVTPIFKGTDLWGLLCIHQCTQPRHWQASEIEFASQLGEQLSVALQQSAYLQHMQAQALQLAHAVEREKTAERQQALANTIDLIRRSLDIPIIFQTATTELRRLLASERTVIYQFHPDWSGDFVAESVGTGWRYLVGKVPTIHDTYLQATQGGVYAEHQTSAVNDIYLAGHQPCHIELLESLEIRAYLIVPIFLGDRLWGLMAAYQHSAPRHWTKDDVTLMSQLSAQMGIALQQAELLEVTRAQTVELNQAFEEVQASQMQVIQNEKMASLGQLVAGVAHELNNPIGFIAGNLTHANGYVEDVMELLSLYQSTYPEATPEIQERVAEIDLSFLAVDLPKTLQSMKSGTERIRDLVVSLRNFSRLDEAAVKAVNLHDGIDSTLVILQHRLKAQTDRQPINLVKDYGDLPVIDCCAAQINQVFMNILGNAIDALEEALLRSDFGKEPTIGIQTRQMSDQVVRIELSNNGLPIPMLTQNRMFDPFFTTKPIGKGTGLGLSISYQIIVERHLGKLGCFTDAAERTVFWIELPISMTTETDEVVE
ncbi:GAF domain-containing sensor histidine kinase [filamentous cyanobacterium LEGE 11480]|uniref:histidine kinase n=2 Tax=Romeriopsis TaxID=2992131 RepID=A0A928VR54_9CYAN|nr:GAF domain-containing sensor histidine kinase [Romeriopsis navalis LEGE 11480]